jgi:hypothetical protein
MLCTGAPLLLQANYTWYLVYLEACQTLANFKNTGTWPSGLKMRSTMDIVLLFIGNQHGMIPGARHFLMSQSIQKWLNG